jgi:hypothetical protein
MPGQKPAGTKRGKDGPAELFDYIAAYAKQETIDPVVRQAKTLGRGIAGALLLSIGTVLLAVGFLRALQAQFGSTSATTTAGGDPSPATPVAPASQQTTASAQTTAPALTTAGTSPTTTTVATPSSASSAVGPSSSRPSSSRPSSASLPTTTAARAVSAPPVATTSLGSSGRGVPTTLVASSAAPNPYGSGHPLSGNWSWVPYMGGALLCLLVTVFCVTRIVRGAKR